MAIYVKGQVIDIVTKLRMKILRAFAVDGTIYYIVWFPSSEQIRTENNSPAYGVFKHDDTMSFIPPHVNQVAQEIIQKEKLLENLGQ